MTTATIQKRESTADAVIHEVRRTKERLAREYGFRRIAAAVRAKQNLSGHEVVSRSKPRA